MSRWLITGANRGIGLELCRQLVARGEDVIATCRGSSSDLDSLGVQVESGIDVGSAQFTSDLVRRLDGQTIDVLVNNAGILERVDLEELDLESIRRQFEINAIGPLRVTRALLDHLQAGSKIAIVTSMMGSIGDNSSGSHYGYRMSKAALNAAGVSLACDLRPREIAVAILHPGMVQTDMTGHRGIPVSESAKGLLARIDELTLENSGTFWHSDGRVLPW